MLSFFGFTSNEEERKKIEAQKLLSKYVKSKYQPDSAEEEKLVSDGTPTFSHAWLHVFDTSPKKKQSKTMRVWKSIRNFVYAFIFICYALLGGLIFSEIEHDESENFYKKELSESTKSIENKSKELYSILKNLNCQNEENENLCKETIQKQFEKVATPVKKIQWDLFSAVFYALTTLTTIGYGSITCKTNLGKFITIIYATVGIPLMVFVLRHNGKFALKSVKELEVLFCGKKKRKGKHRFRTVSIISAMIYASGFWITTSLIIGVIEKFSVLDSFYFSFQTVTTIGFGDIVPSNSFTLSIVILFHFVSLSLLSMVYAIFQEKVEHNYMWALDIIDEEHKKNGESPVTTEMGKLPLGKIDSTPKQK